MHPQQISHLPILVCAIFIWILGAFWYSPLLFARPWAEMVGRPMGEKPKGVVHGMIASFIGDLLLVFVLVHFVVWGGAKTFAQGALIGLASWVGFIIGPLYPQRIYEGKPFAYLAINVGYWLIGLVVAGGILGVWR